MTTLSELFFGRNLTPREFLTQFGQNSFGIPRSEINSWIKSCAVSGEAFLVVPWGWRAKYQKRCLKCRLVVDRLVKSLANEGLVVESPEPGCGRIPR